MENWRFVELHYTGETQKVVIIDDNKELVSLLTEFFQECGLDVVGISGISHIRELVKLKPSLVLLDQKMPKLRGDEIILQMKKNKELTYVPVIVITGAEPETLDPKMK